MNIVVGFVGFLILKAMYHALVREAETRLLIDVMVLGGLVLGAIATGVGLERRKKQDSEAGGPRERGKNDVETPDEGAS